MSSSSGAVNRTLFILVLTCFCYSQNLAQLQLGTAKVGEHCERDYHCINNAFCRAQQTCLCEPNYLPVPDFSLCIPTVGLICANETSCALMSNAECRQNVCACKETYTVDITNSSNCLARPVAENDRCQRNDECIETMDRGLCINGRCQCLTAHHFVQGIGKCVRSAGFFNACDNDYQCYISDEPDLLECRDRLCKCKEGRSSRHCSGAASISATAITVFFLFFTMFLT